MAFQTKRNNSAQPLIDSVGHPDHGGKEMHYVQHTGLSKLEETALRIYTRSISQIHLMEKGQSVNCASFAKASIYAANAFWDEIERADRETSEQYEKIRNANRQQYKDGKAAMLDKVEQGHITMDEYRDWEYNLIGD